jgi:hypothetical protein
MRSARRKKGQYLADNAAKGGVGTVLGRGRAAVLGGKGRRCLRGGRALRVRFAVAFEWSLRDKIGATASANKEVVSRTQT